MALGSVEITSLNLGNGALPGVECTFLFVGLGDVQANHGRPIPITPESDIAELFGEESQLTIQLTAAIRNANSPNFFGYAFSIESSSNWQTLVKPFFDKPTDLDVEGIAVCVPITSKTEVEQGQSFVSDIASTFAKQITVHFTTVEITESQTWSDYVASLKVLTTGVACSHVAIVPNLHGNNLGVVIGRLCNPAVTIGDSPMRVATGALVGLGDMPFDSDGEELNMATLKDLAGARFSVPQWYAGFPGMYWGDHCMLDAPGGDFQVYEYLRVIQAAARRVRILAIRKVADRSLNSSAKSIVFHQTYFEGPLREMSKGIIIAGNSFPGAIQAPIAGDVTITWENLTTVNIALLIAPVACPKKIKAYLALDLNRL